MPLRSGAFRVLALVALLAALADASVYVAAIGSLSAAGPNAAGYDLLLTANRGATVVAVLIAASALLRVRRGTSSRTVIALLAAAAVAALAAVGLHLLGSGLASMHPLQQPRDVESLLLAVSGTGQDLWPVPVVLAVAAALARAARSTARSRTSPV